MSLVPKDSHLLISFTSTEETTRIEEFPCSEWQESSWWVQFCSRSLHYVPGICHCQLFLWRYWLTSFSKNMPANYPCLNYHSCQHYKEASGKLLAWLTVMGVYLRTASTLAHWTQAPVCLPLVTQRTVLKFHSPGSRFNINHLSAFLKDVMEFKKHLTCFALTATHRMQSDEIWQVSTSALVNNTENNRENHSELI